MSARLHAGANVAFAILVVALSASDLAAEPPARDQLRSGYEFARPDTQAFQDDRFANPGFIYVDRGAALWRRPAGAKELSCADCHGDGAQSMAGVGATYPKVDTVSGRLLNLGQRINQCRIRHMAAPPLEPLSYEYESERLLSLEVYLMHQSAGMPLDVAVDGAAAPYFAKGRALYHQRIGQLDLACTMCHDDRIGRYLRAEQISQGHLNGFPTYLLRWDALASAHRRFQFCNEQARAEPLELGAEDYTALQLYVTWRGNGLAIETPAVRR